MNSSNDADSDNAGVSRQNDSIFSFANLEGVDTKTIKELLDGVLKITHGLGSMISRGVANTHENSTPQRSAEAAVIQLRFVGSCFDQAGQMPDVSADAVIHLLRGVHQAAEKAVADIQRGLEGCE